MFKKNTKTALLMSVLALMLSISMFVGSTFAWFTDSVSSVNNIIKSGNLDVEVYYKTADMADWAKVTDDVSLFMEDALWEPGHTEAVALKVVNEGSLAFKYDLSTTVYLEKEGTNVYDETFMLSDSLDIYAKGFTVESDAAALLASTARATVIDGTTLGKFDFGEKITEPTFLKKDEQLLSGGAQYWVIGINMPTTVGNEANHKTGTDAPYIRFGVDVYASQVEFEEDAFGPDYDKEADDARFPYAEVYDKGALTINSEPLFGGGYESGLYGDIKLDAAYTFIAPDDSAMTEWIPAEEFDEWYADYEVSVTGGDPAKLIDGELPEGAIIMSGQYTNNEAEWQSFLTPQVPMDTPIMLLKTATDAMGYGNVHFTYEAIRDFVGTFNCGVKKASDAASGVTMQVALVLYKEDAAGNIIAKKTVGKFNYTFE